MLAATLAGLDQDGRDARHVLVALTLDRRRAQRGGRVVHREDRRVAGTGRRIGLAGGAVGLRDPDTGHEARHRVPAERHDHGRIEHLELALEVRRAGGDLVGLGIAVAGRSALHDVGDEHVVAGPADVAEQAHEQAAGAADERPALAVLVLARALADEDDLGRCVTLARDGIRPGRVEPAASAIADLCRDRRERRAALGVGHAGDPAASRVAAALTHPRSTSTSASWTAFVAAPLRRLSLTIQKARPRSPSIDGSWRTRPT